MGTTEQGTSYTQGEHEVDALDQHVLIRTTNPEALRATLSQLPGGTHEVLVDTYREGVVDVATTNPGFLTFACTQQGYGQVVDAR